MEGLTKQRDFAKSKMKDAFEAGIGQMQGYQEQVSMRRLMSVTDR